MPKRNPVLIIASEVNSSLYQDLPMPGEEMMIVPAGQAVCSMIFRDIDLVLLDCGFDVRLGVGILVDIKHRFPGIPVLFLSDDSSEELVIEIFRRGARDFIRKPFDLFLLQEQVNQLLRAKRGTRELRDRTATGHEHNHLAGHLCGVEGMAPGIMKVVCHLETNYVKNCKLDKMASMAGMSKAHFCRTFKEQVGMSPVRYHRFIRIQRARQLLHNYSLSIAAAAYRVGFHDVSNFNKNFRKFVGVSPTAYRSSLRI
jgi:AraC-like DNA-binding protein